MIFAVLLFWLGTQINAPTWYFVLIGVSLVIKILISFVKALKQSDVI